jgi:hypothetical protein
MRAQHCGMQRGSVIAGAGMVNQTSPGFQGPFILKTKEKALRPPGLIIALNNDVLSTDSIFKRKEYHKPFSGMNRASSCKRLF